MTSYWIDLKKPTLHEKQHDERYQQLKHVLQKGDRDEDYHLREDGFVIFRNMIYVLDNNELKNPILKEFHAKPYLGHLG